MPLPLTYSQSEADTDRTYAESASSYLATILAAINGKALSGDTLPMPAEVGGGQNDKTLVAYDEEPNSTKFPLISGDLTTLGYTVSYHAPVSPFLGYWMVEW